MARRQVLGIEVSEDLVARWVEWFAPDPQPFLVDGPERVPVTAELRDTFELYGLAGRGVSIRWIREAEYCAMTRSDRSALVHDQVRLGRGLVPTVASADEREARAVRDQADGRRFVWWPRLLTDENRLRVIGDFVTNNRPPSQHRELPESAWRAAKALLPGAEGIAGTFPCASGPNCFGTVMAAAGVPGAADEWMQREPFEAWLANAADGQRPSSRRYDGPGVVIVWRDANGQADHAAVTVGSGWALHKPSQGWMSPSMVLRTAALIRTVRTRGLRLHRYVLHDPVGR